MTAFVDFGKKDEYSPKLAMGNTKDIIPLLKEREQKYYAISNYGEVSNWIQQFFTCKDNGIVPILGMETYVNNYRTSGTGGDLFFSKFSPEEEWTKNIKEVSDDEKDLSTIDYNLDLFAHTLDGYYNIIQIHNDAQINGVDKRPRTHDRFLQSHGKGVIAVMPTPYSEISSLIFNGLDKEALEKYNFYKNVFEDVYLAVTIIEADDYKEINDSVIVFCLKNKIKMIPVINSHYNLPSDEKHFDVFRKLSKIRGGMTYEVDICKKMYYKTQEEVKELWNRVLKTDIFTEDILNALFSSLDELCARFKLLELDTSIKMPKFANGVAILREKAFAGLKARGYDKDPKYVERLEYELDNVTRAGFSDYFLLLEDLARWHVDVKKRMFQIGRGSAAGSLVLNCLNITNIDPIKFNLLFERFLDAGRLDEIINKGGTVDGCFEGTTVVKMLNGYKYIRDIMPGDYVISRDGTARKVVGVYITGEEQFHRLVYEVNNKKYYFDVTLNHTFPALDMENGGIIYDMVLGNFMKEDQLVLDEENQIFSKIISLEPISIGTRYDIEIEGLHYYRVCGKEYNDVA